MAKVVTLRKIVSVIANLKENSKYHYPNKRFSLFYYLYYSLLRINRFYIFEKENLADEPIFEFEPPFHVEVKTDADELRQICRSNGLPRECYYADILDLHLCLLLYHGNEIALFYWISFPGEYSRFFKLKQDSVELYFVTTMPNFRRKGLHQKAVKYVCHYLGQAGYHKAVVVTHEKNIAFIKSIFQAGFEHARTISAIGPFNRKIRC